MSNKIFNFINLHQGEENKQKVLDQVTANTSFRGSNLWILACAIIIASVGLNVNSTAVIIGAMLISPLMGPIVGAGFALATYNFKLLQKSMKNLLIATVVSLLVSSIYFYISPFKDVQSELLARTAPNIYDVFIAFFGGLVGVIAITRVEKGNPIPGVAIATALMPPLCTAGYGLATFNLQFFGGAFYLYTINCFFICIATFFVAKYLHYQPVDIVNKKHQRYIRNGITMLIFIMIIPSFYLAYNLWNEKKFNKNIEYFIGKEFTGKGYTVIYKKVNYNSSPRKIELALLSNKITAEKIEDLNAQLGQYDIHNAELVIKQDDTDIKSEILSELGKQDNALTEKDITIKNLRDEIALYKINDPGLDKELKILFPEVESFSIGKLLHNNNADSLNTFMFYKTQKQIDEQKLKNWLIQRLQLKNVAVIPANN